MFYYAILLLCTLVSVRADAGSSPRIVIIGAGASGIAAASRLLENGFENVLILEAEDRIGGRVRTVEFDDYVVDLGAQWVHGEKGNVAYELAAQLDIVEHSTMEVMPPIVYESPGDSIDSEVIGNLMKFYRDLMENSTTTKEYSSAGERYEDMFKTYFENYPEINETMQAQFLWYFNLLVTSMDPAESWHDISGNLDTDYEMCEGDFAMNWKERGYGTILDILMKKFPDPEEELPVLNNTILNTEVTKIDYTNEDGTVKIITNDGKEYIADHVIITVSLGVLKADHETLFEPALPEWKIKNIQGLGFGTACKMYFAFNESWAEDRKNESSGFSFLWNDEKRKEYESDPEKKWILSLAGFFFVQHKPRLLLGWISGEGARLVEELPDDKVFSQAVDTLKYFLSPDFDIGEPIAMTRSHWYKNKHFRGTYSYRTPETDRTNSSAEILSEPIMKTEKPVILFGGEATNNRHFSTVHGAIAAGWREADRLIDLYSDKE